MEFGVGVVADVDTRGVLFAVRSCPKGLLLVKGSRNLRPWWLGARSGGRGSGIHPAGPWIRCSCWQTLWFVLFVFRLVFENMVVIRGGKVMCGAFVVFRFCMRLLMMNELDWMDEKASRSKILYNHEI